MKGVRENVALSDQLLSPSIHVLQVHPWCRMCQLSVPFYGWIVFRWVGCTTFCGSLRGSISSLFTEAAACCCLSLCGVTNAEVGQDRRVEAGDPCTVRVSRSHRPVSLGPPAFPRQSRDAEGARGQGLLVLLEMEGTEPALLPSGGGEPRAERGQEQRTCRAHEERSGMSLPSCERPSGRGAAGQEGDLVRPQDFRWNPFRRRKLLPTELYLLSFFKPALWSSSVSPESQRQRTQSQPSLFSGQCSCFLKRVPSPLVNENSRGYVCRSRRWKTGGALSPPGTFQPWTEDLISRSRPFKGRLWLDLISGIFWGYRRWAVFHFLGLGRDISCWQGCVCLLCVWNVPGVFCGCLLTQRCADGFREEKPGPRAGGRGGGAPGREPRACPRSRR